MEERQILMHLAEGEHLTQVRLDLSDLLQDPALLGKVAELDEAELGNLLAESIAVVKQEEVRRRQEVVEREAKVKKKEKKERQKEEKKGQQGQA